jgi:uncharacterized damage-inducible protein DinB
VPVNAVIRPFYEGWAAEQQRLLDTIGSLTLEQMQLRPAPREYAIWQLASNMAGGRLYWLCRMLGEDDLGHAELFRVDHVTVPGLQLELAGWEDNTDRPRSASELVDAFLKTWDVVKGCLERWDETDLLRQVTATDAWGRTQTITPAQVVWKLITHEAHHGAEISAILRAHGLPTSLNW